MQKTLMILLILALMALSFSLGVGVGAIQGKFYDDSGYSELTEAQGEINTLQQMDRNTN